MFNKEQVLQMVDDTILLFSDLQEENKKLKGGVDFWKSLWKKESKNYIWAFTELRKVCDLIGKKEMKILDYEKKLINLKRFQKS